MSQIRVGTHIIHSVATHRIQRQINYHVNMHDNMQSCQSEACLYNQSLGSNGAWMMLMEK